MGGLQLRQSWKWIKEGQKKDSDAWNWKVVPQKFRIPWVSDEMKKWKYEMTGWTSEVFEAQSAQQ